MNSKNPKLTRSLNAIQFAVRMLANTKHGHIDQSSAPDQTPDVPHELAVLLVAPDITDESKIDINKKLAEIVKDKDAPLRLLGPSRSHPASYVMFEPNSGVCIRDRWIRENRFATRMSFHPAQTVFVCYNAVFYGANPSDIMDNVYFYSDVKSVAAGGDYFAVFADDTLSFHINNTGLVHSHRLYHQMNVNHFGHDIRGCAFARDCPNVLFVMDRKSIMQVDVNTLRVVSRLSLSVNGAVHLHRLAVSSNGKLVALANCMWWVMVLEFIDDKTVKILATIETKGTHVGSMCFSPDGEKLAIVGTSDYIHVCDIKAIKDQSTSNVAISCARIEHGCSNLIDSVMYSPDGKSILIASSQDEAYICRADLCEKSPNSGYSIDNHNARFCHTDSLDDDNDKNKNNNNVHEDDAHKDKKAKTTEDE